MSSIKSELIRLTSQERLYQLEIPLIGLTGGIASGKSSVAKELTKRGHPIICADQLVKQVYQQEQTYQFILEVCPEVCGALGKIHFEVLRKLAFSSPELLSQIENFIYQRLPQAFHSEAEKILRTSKKNYLFYDVPLLFEKSLESFMDVVVLVYCNRDQQIERVQKRDGTTLDTIEKILKKQDPIEEKKSKSDFVIDNSQSKQSLSLEIKKLETYLFKN